MLSIVYPGAGYKRNVHCLFSYELARQLALHLYATPTFRLYFDDADVKRLLLAALLHDINHFPFLHIMQELGPELSQVRILDALCDGTLTSEGGDPGTPSIYEVLSQVEIDPSRFRRYVFPRAGEALSEPDQAIVSMLHSGVDLDKLSYLYLDAYFTGVRYGSGIDYGNILQAASVEALGNSRLHLAFADRAVQALENVVMTRFWNFRSVYWHHTNRAVMAMVMHVARTLYEDEEGGIVSYVHDTIWLDDLEAMRYLDRKYLDVYGKISPLHELEIDRRRLYKRLYTTHPERELGSDDALLDGMKHLSGEKRRQFREHVASGLSDLLSGSGSAVEVDSDDVLYDVPGRKLDSGGRVYVRGGDGQVVPLASLSAPVREVDKNYEALAKRARIFVSPEIARYFPGNRRLELREQIARILHTALRAVEPESDVA